MTRDILWYHATPLTSLLLYNHATGMFVIGWQSRHNGLFWYLTFDEAATPFTTDPNAASRFETKEEAERSLDGDPNSPNAERVFSFEEAVMLSIMTL